MKWALLLAFIAAPCFADFPTTGHGLVNWDAIPAEYRQVLLDRCLETGIPLVLAASMILRESSWNKRARRDNGPRGVDRGLMQLNSKNAAMFSKLYNGGKPIDWYDPDTNIKIGLRFLRDLVRKYGDIRLALYHYNCGRVKNVPQATVELVDREIGGME